MFSPCVGKLSWCVVYTKTSLFSRFAIRLIILQIMGFIFTYFFVIKHCPWLIVVLLLYKECLN